MAQDPVCGRDVNPKQSQWLLSYEGNTYHFCSGGCEHRFNEHPTEFTDHAGAISTETQQPMASRGSEGSHRESDMLYARSHEYPITA